MQAYIFAVSRNRPDKFGHEFLVAASEWYVWAALTPLVLWLCRRFRITSQISFVQLAVQVRLNYMVNPGYVMLGMVHDVLREFYGGNGPIMCSGCHQGKVKLKMDWKVLPRKEAIRPRRRSALKKTASLSSIAWRPRG